MSVAVIIRPLAEADIDEAHRWYEAQREGLGGEFLDEVDVCLARIGASPQIHPFALKDARRASMKRFPYSIYFRVRKGTAYILAVVHHARGPRVWRRRVR